MARRLTWSEPLGHLSFRRVGEGVEHRLTALLARRDDGERRISRYSMLCRVGREPERASVSATLTKRLAAQGEVPVKRPEELWVDAVHIGDDLMRVGRHEASSMD